MIQAPRVVGLAFSCPPGRVDRTCEGSLRLSSHRQGETSGRPPTRPSVGRSVRRPHKVCQLFCPSVCLSAFLRACLHGCPSVPGHHEEPPRYPRPHTRLSIRAARGVFDQRGVQSRTDPASVRRRDSLSSPGAHTSEPAAQARKRDEPRRAPTGPCLPLATIPGEASALLDHSPRRGGVPASGTHLLHASVDGVARVEGPTGDARLGGIVPVEARLDAEDAVGGLRRLPRPLSRRGAPERAQGAVQRHEGRPPCQYRGITGIARTASTARRSDGNGSSGSGSDSG